MLSNALLGWTESCYLWEPQRMEWKKSKVALDQKEEEKRKARHVS